VAERSPEEREAYYTQNQVSDRLRSDVESLLQAGENTINLFADRVASAAVRALLDPAAAPEPSAASGTLAPAPAPAPPPILLQPTVIGRYQVNRLVGRGGMSEVYLARDPMLERDIAVKLLTGEIDSEVARRRLAREASAAGRLRHPNIVTIFDAGEHEGRSFIAMEYVPGETLRSIIRRRLELPLRRRLELIEGACAGLAHAHRAGVVHLDVKPDNLIVDDTGVVKVLDFGIARVLSNNAFATRHVVGTLRYMSPEQIAGEPLDHRSDVFSLGCSLYEMLSYLPAYSGSTREIVYRIAVGPVPRIAEVVPDIDPRLDEAIGRAMALEPDDRFADLDEFRAELARLRVEIDPVGDRPMQMPEPQPAEDVRTFAVPSPTPSRTLRSSRRTTTEAASAPPAPSRSLTAPLAATAAVAVAVALGALWYAMRPAPEAPPASASNSALAGAASPVAAPPPVEPPPAIAASADGSEVWRLLTAGDRAGVIRILKESGADGANARLPADVVGLVKKNVLQSRETATATPGAAGSPQYRTAEDRLGSANRLEARDPVGALGLLWEAADLYARSAATARANAPVPSATPTPQAPSDTLAAAPPAVLPSPAVITPEAITPPPPRTQSPATSSAARGAPPAAAAASPAAESPRAPSETEAVLGAIDRYRLAFEARDIAPLLRVYPSLNPGQAEQLRKTFESMTEYQLDVRDPRVQVQGDSATVRTVLVRRITPRVGSRQSYEGETEFRLRRMGSAWQITDVIAK
jgi:serine/threonine-protein kinase